jgi:membrane protease YdiL (CAAX protease family)
MGWVTLIGFPAVALGILYGVSGSWQHIFTGGWPIYVQLLLGTAVGLATGFGLRAFLNLPFLHDITNDYSGVFKNLELTRDDYVFISVCAGVGEEILFRGCIQEYAGILPTAILFVAVHGYLNPLNYKISSYGLLLTGLFIGVGYLMQYTGLYTCIALHIVIDIILFGHLISSAENKN